MKKLMRSLLVFAACTGLLHAQSIEFNPDDAISTKHKTTVKGVSFDYTATTGMMPVWNLDGKPIAAVHFTYYERDGISDRSMRPLVFSFNGGPGAASLWMQLGYTGPVKLKIDEEGYPIMPYGTENNPYSLLDVADIVFVNPVNTGYSRILDKSVDRGYFFGVNEDIAYLSGWIRTFITRYNRWTSPKFLIGESYGTTRVSGLAMALQSRENIFLNGVVLVSATDLGLRRDGPVREAIFLPYMAATAWYHKKLPADLQQKDLLEVLPEVERFTIEEYIPALAWGGSLPEQRRTEIARRVSRYSGISQEAIINYNLTISTNFFWKELLRDEGYTVGRLDSRYRGKDVVDGGERPEYNAEMVAWNQAFTPAINHYFANNLKYKTDLQYYVSGPVRPWNTEGNNTGNDLMRAVAQNPWLHVMLQAGYYDGACDYFSGQYNFWQMDKGGKFQERFSFRGYRSGHMMYLRYPDLQQANEDIREFIHNSMPDRGKAARY
ncbi:MAG: hypothetical protein FWE30_01515 [Bacteroidales bacterium]|nr:hypothetical protein [Bacteroidales bacterium]